MAEGGPLAAAVEMVHTYSLIHDDLPCMDNDDYRRGRLTNHKVYGEATAVLAGDALLTAAFSSLTAAPYSPETRVRGGDSGAVRRGAWWAASCWTWSRRNGPVPSRKFWTFRAEKPGPSFRAACLLGVLAGGGSEAQEQAAGTFADHLGLAFQIRDDMLDVIGDAQTLGKAVGVDECKNTFVRLYGMEACQALVTEHTELAVAALTPFADAAWLQELAESLTDRRF